MTYEEKVSSIEDELKGRDFLGDRLISVKLKRKPLMGLEVAVSFTNYWNKKRKITFHLMPTKTGFAERIQETPRKKGVSCDNVNLSIKKGVLRAEVRDWIYNYIRRLLVGSRKEVMAFEFFKELAKEGNLLGEPIKATKFQDRKLGTDFFVPVKKRNREDSVNVPIDIKSDNFYQALTLKKNKQLGRKVSTLCFSRMKDLVENTDVLIERIVRHGRRQKPFNIDLTKPAR